MHGSKEKNTPSPEEDIECTRTLASNDNQDGDNSLPCPSVLHYGLEGELAGFKADKTIFGTAEDLVKLTASTANLAEKLFTTMFFEEEKFDFYQLVFIFTFLPIVEYAVKLIVYSNRLAWDDFVAKVLSEGFQACLYIHFCGYSSAANLWIPIMMSLQIFPHITLLIGRKHFRRRQNKSSDVSPSLGCPKHLVLCVFCFSLGLLAIAAGLIPIIGILAQNEIPPTIRKTNEMVFATVFWLTETVMAIVMATNIHATELAHSELDICRDGFAQVDDNSKQKIFFSFLLHPRSRSFKLLRILCVALYVMLGYMLASSWVWLFITDQHLGWIIFYALVSISYGMLGHCFFVFFLARAKDNASSSRQALEAQHVSS